MRFSRPGRNKSLGILCFVLLIAGCAGKKEMARVYPSRDAHPFLVAVLPVENLSGRPAPLKELRRLLSEGLRERGIVVLEEDRLDKFMAKYRLRYTGGIHKELTLALLRETGANAVLITSVDYFTETAPPKIAFFSRLVSTGGNPTIIWMKALGMAGDDHPGILGLGLIGNPQEVVGKALGEALNSLSISSPGGMTKVPVKTGKSGKFQPKRFYRSPEFDFGKSRVLTVAVIPFLNDSTRKSAGEAMALHFVNRLAEIENIQVIEPGEILQELLRHRIIMQDGLSVAQADLLFATLEADLFVTGEVAEYQDFEGPTGTPRADFTVLVFEKKSKRVIFSSRSYNRGDDGVFFFDRGEVRSAGVMASEMVRAVVGRMFGKG